MAFCNVRLDDVDERSDVIVDHVTSTLVQSGKWRFIKRII